MAKEDFLPFCRPLLPSPAASGSNKSGTRAGCFGRRRKVPLLCLTLTCMCVMAWSQVHRLATSASADHHQHNNRPGPTSSSSPANTDGVGPDIWALFEVESKARLPDLEPASGDLVGGPAFQNDVTGNGTGGLLRVRRSGNKSAQNITCSKAGQEFPANIFTKEDTEEGGWVLNLAISIYVFGCIAQVCDDYFVPSLEHFCEDLGLSPDVAGATFMAAGSSAPELATSLIGLFVAKSNVGVGAIVGSSIFNILVIVGAVGVLAGMPLQVSWYPVTRDVVFYVASVASMVGSMADNHILWWEATLMVLLYTWYILLMIFNARIRDCLSTAKVGRKLSYIDGDVMRRTSRVLAKNMEARGRSRIANRDPTTLKSVDQTLKSIELIDKDQRDLTLDAIRKASAMRLGQTESKATNTGERRRYLCCSANNTQVMEPHHMKVVIYQVVEEERGVVFESSIDPHVITTNQSATAEDGDPASSDISEIVVDEYVNPLTIPDGCLAKVYYFAFLPTTALHAYTIPDSRISGGWQAKMYPLSFALSVAYIAIYSYIMVWMALYAGSGIGIPDTVVGLTILAAGTSVPDLMSSVYIARDGYGDMAVSNAIGSNIFDILIGLGMPWLINSLMQNEDGTDMNNRGLFYMGITLFVSAIFVWILFLICHWTLTKMLGWVVLVSYVLIITLCTLVEMNMLFDFKVQCG